MSGAGITDGERNQIQVRMSRAWPGDREWYQVYVGKELAVEFQVWVEAAMRWKLRVLVTCNRPEEQKPGIKLLEGISKALTPWVDEWDAVEWRMSSSGHSAEMQAVAWFTTGDAVVEAIRVIEGASEVAWRTMRCAT